MRRIFALALALMLAFSMLGLAEEGHREADKELMDASAAMLSRMLSLTGSEGYVELYASADEIIAITDELLAHDLTVPQQTIVLSLSADGLTDALVELDKVMDLGLNEACFEDKALFCLLGTKLLSAIPSFFNGFFEGTAWLAAQAILNAQDVLELEHTKDALVMVLRYYGEDRPCTYVGFAVKEDGLALANAGFVKLPSELMSMLLDKGTLDMLMNMGFVSSQDQLRIQVYEGSQS